MQTSPSQTDSFWMHIALRLARQGAALGEVPVGAIVVLDGRLVGANFNQREGPGRALGHAELGAIEQANQRLHRWRLNDCTLYVTLEPCLMCAGAIVQSRLGRVVYGARDAKAGAVESLYRVLDDERLNHRPEVCSGVEAQACSQILSDFFRKLRRQDGAPPA